MLPCILKGKQTKTLKKKKKQLTLIVCHLQQYPGVIPAVKQKGKQTCSLQRSIYYV